MSIGILQDLKAVFHYDFITNNLAFILRVLSDCGTSDLYIFLAFPCFAKSIYPNAWTSALSDVRVKNAV